MEFTERTSTYNENVSIVEFDCVSKSKPIAIGQTSSTR